LASKLDIPNQPRILVIGSGAREHAIVWKLAQSARNPVLFAAPGNPGIAMICTCVGIAVTDVQTIAQFAQEHAIDLVVIGPEQPLAAGLADACARLGIRVFGPTAAAAQVETSKSFAKDLMDRAHVPTAKYATFTQIAAARAYVRAEGAPIVIKADGLAAGKGVVVAETLDEALGALDDMMQDGVFGQAGSQVVVESFMTGREVSLMYFVDGETVVPMVSARDHKRLQDGDAGPNTGGMGAFAPVPSFATTGMADVVTARIVRPTLRALADMDIRYQGVLYVGLMITPDGPQVVEFNARFGDPETEVVLPLLRSDLVDVLWAVAADRLSDVEVAWHTGAAVCVVLAAQGYPTAPQANGEITIRHAIAAAQPTAPVVFHAGTKAQNGALYTAGGRVLTVAATGDTLAETRTSVYKVIGDIHFKGMQYRTDIALQSAQDD